MGSIELARAWRCAKQALFARRGARGLEVADGLEDCAWQDQEHVPPADNGDGQGPQAARWLGSRNLAAAWRQAQRWQQLGVYTFGEPLADGLDIPEGALSVVPHHTEVHVHLLSLAAIYVGSEFVHYTVEILVNVSIIVRRVDGVEIKVMIMT